MNHEKEHPQPVIKTVHKWPVEAGYTPQPFDPSASDEKQEPESEK
jgi:hypothetical protein